MTTTVASRGRTFRSSHAEAALLAIVIGLGVGRFLFFSPAPVSPAPAPPVAATAPDAVAALEQRVAAVPGDGVAWQRLGAAYVRRAAETADPAFYGLADRALDRAVATGVRVDVTRGTLALSLHRFDEALVLGQRAVAADRFDDQALGVLVDAQVELGRYDEAAAGLQAMLDIRPGLAALSRASYLRQLHGDLAGAIEAMQQAEAAGAGAAFDRAGVVALLGDLHLARGDTERAGASYERALELFPNLPAAVVGRARVLAATGSTAQAIESLQALVARVPLPGAAALLAELDPGEQAVGLVQTITRLQADAGQVTDLEAALFEADHGDPILAVELAGRAHAVRPANVFAADALAWSLHRAGDTGAAVALLPDVLRLGTADADALLRYHVAAIRAAAGDRMAAAADLRAAFELNPWFSFGLRAEAGALAKSLGVPVPAVWESR